MTMDLVLVTPDECFSLAERVAKSGLVPQAYRNKPTDAAIAMMYGQEMGLPPMTALQRVVVINGKPTLDAQGMVALIRQAGHSVSGEVTSECARIVGTRGDNSDTMTVTFTMDDAKKADLLKNATYRKFPTDMLWARAVTQLGRRLFADVLMGASYAPEEMQAVVGDNEEAAEPVRDVVTVRPPPNAPVADNDTGEIIDAEVVETSAPDDPQALAEAKAGLREVVNIQAPSDRNALNKDLTEKYGAAASRTLKQLAEATEFDAGWKPTGEPEPVAVGAFGFSEEPF